MADDTNTNIPRPIGIKPITIKPMTPPASAGDAPAPAAPAPAAPPPAPAAAPSIKPIAIDPSAGGKPLGPVATTATIRLKPVMPTQMSAPVGVRPDAPTAPMKPVRPQTIQPPTIKPSTQPTPEAAAKAKTARILLDAALNEIPSGMGGSAASVPAAPVGKITSKITSNLTADILKAAKSQTSRVSLPQQASADSGQPRTLRLKVPTPGETASVESGESLAEAPTVKKKKSLVLKKDKMDAALAGAQGPTITAGADSEESANVSAFSAFQGPPPKKMNPIFAILAIASVFVIAALTVLYMSQACGLDRSLTGFVSFPGLPAPSWPGKVLAF